MNSGLPPSAGLRPWPDGPTLARARVLVVGDVMLDRYWHGAVDRISPEAPVPVVRVQREEERLGAAANVALNVVHLGAPATLVGVVGPDAAGQQLAALAQAAGIQPQMQTDPQIRTTVKLRVIGRQQQLLRLDFEDTPAQGIACGPAGTSPEWLDGHRVLLGSDYGKGALAEIPSLIQRARSCGLPVLVDPKGTDYQRYRGATVLTPNRHELQQVLGAWRDEADLIARAQALRTQLDLSALLLTRSEEGMTLFDDQGHQTVHALAREVFDVTGAGDTVIAMLATLLACGWTLREAMPWANLAAGIVVGKFGTATTRRQELLDAAAQQTLPREAFKP